MSRKSASTGGWKVVAGRVTGPTHVDAGLPCQDAFSYQALGDSLLVAAVSDGAGSALHAGIGAYTTSESVVRYLTDAILHRSRLPSDPAQLVESAVEAARAALAAQAERMPQPARLRDFHATLVGCLADSSGGWFFHIGDGAACAAPAAIDGSGPHWGRASVSPPANGEYANETFFVTQDDWLTNLRILRFDRAQTIVLMSDGVTPFAMLPGCSGPEEKFIGPVDSFLAAQDPATGEQALVSTLDDERARRVSGDDKTLIWARWIR